MHNGHIKRITDADIKSSVLEVMSSNVSTTYITCPAGGTAATLGIKLPFLVRRCFCFVWMFVLSGSVPHTTQTHHTPPHTQKTKTQQNKTKHQPPQPNYTLR